MFKVNEIVKNTNAEIILEGKREDIDGFSIDSRIAKENDIFIPISGEKFDGHNFINEAIKKKITAVVIEKEKLSYLSDEMKKTDIAFLVCDNTVSFLGELAAYNRKKFNTKVIAITGSSGKTTVKELTKNIFKKKFNTVFSEKSFNNNIGLPLTLLKLNKNHHYAITELGMNNLGEIEYLSKIAMPDIALINNVGSAHIGNLGSYENIQKAKSEIFIGLKKDGVAVLNADDKSTSVIKKSIKQRVLTFGVSDEADIRAQDIKIKGIKSSFLLKTDRGKIKININSAGHFMVLNALAAASIGYLNELSLEDIKEGIEDYSSFEKRMEIIKTKQGFNVINDTYNANPDSMLASINTLKILKGNDNAFLIVGDMFEMGDFAESCHKEVGKEAGLSDFKAIYATGEFAKYVKEGATLSGFNKKEIFIGSKEEIVKNIKLKIKKNDWVLIKGSRGMKMEEVTNQLI